MIVEFFGPPGVGKTTLAGELAARLRESGCQPKVVLSYRPNEYAVHNGGSAERHPRGAAIRRLVRPITEVLAMAGHRSGNQPPCTQPKADIAATLMRILPPHGIICRLRMHQYLTRLDRAWHGVEDTDEVGIIDQGFVQAVYSLVSFGGSSDRQRIAQALLATPKPDLLVRLDEPREVIAERLAQRRLHQSRAERLLDLDVATNLATLPIIDVIDELARKQGLAVMRVNAAGRSGLHDAVTQIDHKIHKRSAVEQRKYS